MSYAKVHTINNWYSVSLYNSMLVRRGKKKKKKRKIPELTWHG